MDTLPAMETVIQCIHSLLETSMRMAQHFAMEIAMILMNITIAEDIDGDGQSTCDGDCDDFDATGDTLDQDGDGQTTCDGDCDDFDLMSISVQPT